MGLREGGGGATSHREYISPAAPASPGMLDASVDLGSQRACVNIGMANLNIFDAASISFESILNFRVLRVEHIKKKTYVFYIKNVCVFRHRF